MRGSTTRWRHMLTLGSILFLGASTLPLAAPAPPANPDVRVLIDISGSMRQNDPENLRRPALRMLAGLMQPGNRAGVWTFARWVNNLVPVADVDAGWKKRTQALSEQITSPGQFTNIEEVLDRASADWVDAPVTHARHLVLLTDGMVDVSKEADENAASRRRIIEDLIPRLKADGVKVHTIALSERADHDLMKRLAGETGGWYQQVAQADELQRAFLHMFETVGTPDALPLQDNGFTVDGSIREATVLVFRKPEAPPTVLRSPGGDEFRDSDLPAGVAWFRDQGYDLITVAEPEKGRWTLEADVDPDNRVMIVTDLKLRVSEIPSHVAVGEPVRIEAHLDSKGEVVTRPAFLRLLDVKADVTDIAGRRPLALADDGAGDDAGAADGRYTTRYRESEARDAVEMLVAVESPTFMREKRFRLTVRAPAGGEVVTTTDGAELSMRLETAVMQPEATVEAWQTSPTGERVALAVADVAAGEWRAALVDAQAPVYFEVSGPSQLGNLVEHRVGPLVAPGVPVPQIEPVVAEPAPAPVAVEPPQPQETPAAPAASPDAPEPAAAPAGEDWLMPVLVFVGFNLVLALGGGAWWYLRRRRGGSDDDLALDDAGDGAKDPPAAAQGRPEAKEDAA